MGKKLNTTLTATIFKNCPVVFVAACAENNKTENIPELVQIMSEFAFIPQRNIEAPFLFAVDHCFGIKGQGTVMTGTVLQGSVQINDVSRCNKRIMRPYTQKNFSLFKYRLLT